MPYLAVSIHHISIVLFVAYVAADPEIQPTPSRLADPESIHFASRSRVTLDRLAGSESASRSRAILDRLADLETMTLDRLADPEPFIFHQFYASNE